MGGTHGCGRSSACLWAFAVAAMLALSLTVPARAEAKPVVLLIHGGGYYLDYGIIHPAATVFEAHGLQPVLVDYAIGDIAQARRDVRAAAGRFPDRTVFAYGESAGGGLAAMLAQSDLIDAAALHSPLADLTEERWAGLGREFGCWWEECLRRFSPALSDARQPTLAMVPEQDQAVDPRRVLDWAANDPLVRSISYPGGHLEASPLGSVGDLERFADFFLSVAGPGRDRDEPQM